MVRARTRTRVRPGGQTGGKKIKGNALHALIVLFAPAFPYHSSSQETRKACGGSKWGFPRERIFSRKPWSKSSPLAISPLDLKDSYLSRAGTIAFAVLFPKSSKQHGKQYREG